MSALTRARVSSFLAGAAIAAAFGIVQLRHDLEEHRAALSNQVHGGQLPGRMAGAHDASPRQPLPASPIRNSCPCPPHSQIKSTTAALEARVAALEAQGSSK